MIALQFDKISMAEAKDEVGQCDRGGDHVLQILAENRMATVFHRACGQGCAQRRRGCGKGWGLWWITCAYPANDNRAGLAQHVVHKHPVLWMICTVRRKLSR